MGSHLVLVLHAMLASGKLKCPYQQARVVLPVVHDKILRASSGTNHRRAQTNSESRHRRMRRAPQKGEMPCASLNIASNSWRRATPTVTSKKLQRSSSHISPKWRP